MIIYIGENKEMLIQSAERHDWELITEEAGKGSLNLKKFIEKKLQVITNLQYLVLDRGCLCESDQELEEVIETIRVIWEPQIILLAEELADDNGEQQKVIYGEHITYLYKYQDNLERNIEYLLDGEKIPAEEIYEGIWIGVISANSGAGATHISIGLANYIKQHGERVCYVEANESGDLNAMAAFYGMEKTGENHYQKDGIDYWHQSIDPEKKFAVLDLGKYNSAKLNLFNQCRIKILITDGKPYRMADALNVLRYIEDEQTKLWLNFTSDNEEYERVREEYLGSLNHAAGRIRWHKDMFQQDDNLYQDALKEYIHIRPEKQSRIAFILHPDKLKKKRFSEAVMSRKKQSADGDASKQSDNRDETARAGINQDASGEAFKAVPEKEETRQEVFEEMPELLHEEPEELPDKIPEEDFAPDIEEEELPENTISSELATDNKSSSPKKRKAASANMLLLLLVIAAAFTAVMSPKIMNHFLFNNQESEQITTELVDEELNINPDIKISVLEVEGADGYEVSYSTDKDFDKKATVIVEVETADKAVESLAAGRTYYVRVRAFKFNEDGTKVYGEYTDVQEIKT